MSDTNNSPVTENKINHLFSEQKIVPAIVLELRSNIFLYKDEGKWGFARRSSCGALYKTGEPDYDTIYDIGGGTFAARKKSKWCFIDRVGFCSSNRRFHDLESVIRHSHFCKSSDARLFSEAATAVRPDEILKSVPQSQLVVFRHGERWGVGNPENKYLAADQVIPLVYFDAEQITVVQTARSREAVFVGARGYRWVVYCGGDEPVCDYAEYGEALESARRWIAKLSRYNFEKILLVNEIGESHSGNLSVFRLGGQWGVGYRTCIVHWGRSMEADNYVLPVAGWFETKDVEYVDFVDDEECLWRYFIGKTRDHWSLYDYEGSLLDVFASLEEAQQSIIPFQEPEPIGDIDHSPFDDDAGPPPELQEEWEERIYVEPESIGGS